MFGLQVGSLLRFVVMNLVGMGVSGCALMLCIVLRSIAYLGFPTVLSGGGGGDLIDL